MDITEEFNEISDELYSNSFSLFGYSGGPFIDPVFILNYCGALNLSEFQKNIILVYFGFLIKSNIKLSNDDLKKSKTYIEFKNHLLDIYFNVGNKDSFK